MQKFIPVNIRAAGHIWPLAADKILKESENPIYIVRLPRPRLTLIFIIMFKISQVAERLNKFSNIFKLFSANSEPNSHIVHLLLYHRIIFITESQPVYSLEYNFSYVKF